MGYYRLCMLGEAVLEGPTGPTPLHVSRGDALLCYVAAQPERVFARGQLANLFWSDTSELPARQHLAAALERLEQTLPVMALRIQGETVTWNPDTDLFTDTAHFLALTRVGSDNPEPWRSPVAMRSLEEAAQLWRGPFLQGVSLPVPAFVDWLQEERRVWEQRMLQAVGTLAEAQARLGDWKSVAEHARRALALNPLQERFHRLLMQAAYNQGDHAGALAQFGACVKVLRERLGVSPDSATYSLRDQIRAGRSPNRLAPVSIPAPTKVTPPRALEPIVMPAQEAPLTGREREVSELLQVVTMAMSGRGRLIVVQGEPGIGKSRLAAAVMTRLQQEQRELTLLRGQSYDSLHFLHYAPFVSALRNLLLSADLSALPLEDVYWAELQRLFPEVSLLRPGLALRPPRDEFDDQRRLFDAVARLLAALPRPLVLLLEDLQWIDDASLLLLTYLFRQPTLAHLVVLATARSGEMPEQVQGMLHQWQHEEKLLLYPVSNLSLPALQSLTAAVTGQADPQLALRLYKETQGNPLFVVEILRSICDQNGLLSPDGAWPADLSIPGTVQAAIRLRLDRLPPPMGGLLKAASIFPAPVPLDLLRAVAAMAEEPFVDALEGLIQSGLMSERREGQCLVGFSHDLVRRVVRSDLSHARLLRLHRAALSELESQGSGETAPEQLAFHATAAERWAEGLAWSLKAATNSERVFAYPAAASHLEQALICTERMPSTPELRRQALGIRLQLSRMGHYFNPGRLDEWLAPAVAIAPDLGDADVLSQAWLARSSALTVQGRLLMAQPIFERLLPIARLFRSRTLLVPILTLLGGLHGLGGRHKRCVDMLDEAMSLTKDKGLWAIYAGATQASVLATVGAFARAVPNAAEYARRAREMGDPALRGFTMSVCACVAYFRGSWEESIEAALEAIDQSRKGGARLYEYIATVWLGLSLFRTGEPQAGLEALQHATKLAKQVRSVMLLDRVHVMLGELYLELGRLAEAEAEVRQGLQIAGANGYRFGQALGKKVLGQLAAAKGRHKEAKLLLSQALEGFQEVGSRPEEGRCHGLLMLLEDSHVRRCEHYRQAASLFSELQMEWDLAALRRSRPGGLDPTG